MAPRPESPAPGAWDIFRTCLWIGALSFGGGLSGWIYREFVEKAQWVDDADFIATLTICQILPGANVLNLVICLGEDLAGLGGAIGAFVGFLIGPVLGVIGLYWLLNWLNDPQLLSVALTGVAFAAAGLLIQICWRGVQNLRSHPTLLLIAALVALLVGVAHVPILAAVALTAPISIAFAAWREPTDE